MDSAINPSIPEDEMWITHRDSQGQRDGVIVIPLASWKHQGPAGDDQGVAAWQALYPDARFRPASDPLVQQHWAWVDARAAQTRQRLGIKG